MPVLSISLTDKSRKIRYNRRKLLRLARAVLRSRMKAAVVEIDVVSSRQIARVNRRFLRYRGATDVICFNLGKDEAGRLWGQIVVCDEVARKVAARRKARAEDELALYVAHGLYHFLGETDDDDAGRGRMQRLAVRALVNAGYTEP